MSLRYQTNKQLYEGVLAEKFPGAPPRLYRDCIALLSGTLTGAQISEDTGSYLHKLQRKRGVLTYDACRHVVATVDKLVAERSCARNASVSSHVHDRTPSYLDNNA